MAVSTLLDIPEYYYFESLNDYIGSLNGFNFKIATQTETINEVDSKLLRVYLYHGNRCFELSTPYVQKDFEHSSKGLSALAEWIETEYQKHTQTEYYKKFTIYE